MLYLISIGLHDERDLSLRAIDACKMCNTVYAEFYTTKLKTDADRLTKLLGKHVTELSRQDLEELSGRILREAIKSNVAILVGGDALCATTHISLVMEAKRMGVTVRIIHGSSVFSAIGETGLQPYKFGKTITLAYGEEGYVPLSFYDASLQNKKRGLHTLLLLDIQKEQGRYMTVADAIEILEGAEKAKRAKLVTPTTKLVAAADLGGDSLIRYGTMDELKKSDAASVTPAVLIIPGDLHFMEQEYLEFISKPETKTRYR